MSRRLGILAAALALALAVGLRNRHFLFFWNGLDAPWRNVEGMLPEWVSYSHRSPCYSSLTWSSAAWDAAEAAAAPAHDAPVPEAAVGDGRCPLSDPHDWHTPFILRAGADAPVWTAERLAPYLPERVHVVDQGRVTEHWSEMRDCPDRAIALTQGSVYSHRVVSGDHARMYARFEEDALTPELEAAIGLGELRNFCGTLNGYAGEMFFGWGSKKRSGSKKGGRFRVGTPFHAAQMGNLFKQLAGERNWTLVSPTHMQGLRPFHGLGYVFGLGAYRPGADGWAGDGSGWTDAFERLTPKLTVTTRPGDLLYIPAWWMHEIRVDDDEFSFGVSTRAFGWNLRNWQLWPVLRFLPGVNPSGAGATGVTLDMLHANWWLLVRLIQQVQMRGVSGAVRYLMNESMTGRKGEIQGNLA